jgi:16S rRNA (guanine966-N2)-methyltransferase
MRIVAGQFRGRRLAAPSGLETRPIPDRVKVSLFGMLDPYLAGAAVADLFCGTGSFGLEALSRGARHCWFAELDRPALTGLRQNIEMLGVAQQATIWSGDILRRLEDCLAQLSGPLDIVSLDPPFAMSRDWFSGEDERGGKLLAALAGVLAEEGLISVRTQRDVKVAAHPAGLVEARRREYGSMAITFLRH